MESTERTFLLVDHLDKARKPMHNKPPVRLLLQTRTHIRSNML